MPNWVSQDLIVAGPKKYRRMLLDSWLAKPDRRFSDFVPRPEDIGEGWYDWSLKNWGTKWGDCETRLAALPDCREMTQFSAEQVKEALGLKYTHWWFRSAWSSSGELIRRISLMYPQLVFGLTFVEESDEFIGWEMWFRGWRETDFYFGTTPPSHVVEAQHQGDYDAYSEWRGGLEMEAFDHCMEQTVAFAEKEAKMIPLVDFVGQPVLKMVQYGGMSEERGLNSMTGAAIAMHEWFLSLKNAGFTEAQALKLIAATMKNNAEDDEE